MQYNQNIQNKLYGYFTNKFGMYDYRRGWLKGDCPFCGKHKFGINLSLGRANCFSCGPKENPLKLILHIERINFQQLNPILNQFDGYTYRAPEVVLKDGDPIQLPEHFRLITDGDSVLAKAVRHRVRKRGFKVEDLSLKGFGYCDDGKYSGYLIIPWYMGGRLVMWNARLVVGSGPKYQYPDVEDLEYSKSQVLYNYDSLFLYDRVFIMESVFNCETIGDNTVGLGGKTASSHQLSDLIRSPVKRYNIILDPDAVKEAYKLAIQLSKYKKVKVVHWSGTKDVNDLGRRRTLNRVYNHRYLTTNQFLIERSKHEPRSINTY